MEYKITLTDTEMHVLRYAINTRLAYLESLVADLDVLDPCNDAQSSRIHHVSLILESVYTKLLESIIAAEGGEADEK